jgi:hypothetical protein
MGTTIAELKMVVSGSREMSFLAWIVRKWVCNVLYFDTGKYCEMCEYI